MVFHTNLTWEFVRPFIGKQGKIRDGSCFYFISHGKRSMQANFGTCITIWTILPLIFRTNRLDIEQKKKLHSLFLANISEDTEILIKWAWVAYGVTVSVGILSVLHFLATCRIMCQQSHSHPKCLAHRVHLWRSHFRKLMAPVGHLGQLLLGMCRWLRTPTPFLSISHLGHFWATGPPKMWPHCNFLKRQPHFSQSCCENANPSSGTSPVAHY